MRCHGNNLPFTAVHNLLSSRIFLFPHGTYDQSNCSERITSIAAVCASYHASFIRYHRSIRCTLFWWRTLAACPPSSNCRILSSWKISVSPPAQGVPSSIMLTLLMSIHLSYLTAPHVSANLMNVTVDDQGVDPLTGSSISYTPLSIRGWKRGQLCTECNARPDPTQTFNGTWHHAAYRADHDAPDENLPQTAMFNFSGMIHRME